MVDVNREVDIEETGTKRTVESGFDRQNDGVLEEVHHLFCRLCTHITQIVQAMRGVSRAVQLHQIRKVKSRG